MKCSEAIAILQASIAEHGDLELGCQDAEFHDCGVATIEVVESNRLSNPISYIIDAEELGDKFVKVSLWLKKDEN